MMDSDTMHDLLNNVDLGPEPPIGSLVEDARRAGAARRRRHQVINVAAGIAVLVVVIGGVAVVNDATRHVTPHSTAIAGARPTPPPTGPVVATAPLPPGVTLPLPTPTVPTQALTGNRVPTTAKSYARLMLDVLPTGANHSGPLTSTTDHRGHPDHTGASAETDVTVTGRSGAIMTAMTEPHQGAITPCGTHPEFLACADFTLAGGITVQEYIVVAGQTQEQINNNGYRYVMHVAVRRPTGVTVDVGATNYPLDMSAGASGAVAMTFGQLITAAGDPRWAWTMPKSYVDAAKHLHIDGGTEG